jgi:folate-binding protein YgfZ
MWKFLGSSVVLSVEGADARRYLHNRLSNSIRDLAIGSSIDAAALNAKGRVEALFLVSCTGEEKFLLCADGGDAEFVRDALMRFAVADRVVCTDISERSVRAHAIDVISGDCVPDVSARKERIADSGFDVVWFDRSYADIRISLEETMGLEASDREYFVARWNRGVAVFPDEINSDMILTESGMMNAVSFNKGCYVGQEVIERSDAIGKLPRTLARIRLESSVLVEGGATVYKSDGTSIGKAISCGLDMESSSVLVFAMLGAGKYQPGESITCADIRGVVLETKGATI